MINEKAVVLEPSPMPDFVETEYVKDVAGRAISYIGAGFPVHFRGGAGTGKTTLAMHIANKLEKPIVLIHGDEELTTSDLVGGAYGYHFRKIVDRFVSKVIKIEEDITKSWADNHVTVACKYGFTLIYDEFTRSRPEANNVLLSILQEKIMDLPAERNTKERYLKCHPNFVAIFTSNPEEYAGVHKSQDALRDRMVTIDLDYFDYETEVEITLAKSGISRTQAEMIINIVRGVRKIQKLEFKPTVRSCIIIGKTIKFKGIDPVEQKTIFTQICQDILASETSRIGSKTEQDIIRSSVEELVNIYIQGQS